MIILKWIPKQAGCYKLNQLLLAFLCMFCSESLPTVAVFPISSRIPLRLSGWLAGQHGMREEEEEDGRFTGPGCPRSRGALLRPAASLPHLLAWLGRLCPQASIGKWNWSDFMPSSFAISSSIFWVFLFHNTFLGGTSAPKQQHQTVVAELQQQYKFLVAVPRWGWGMFKPRDLLQ